MKYPNFQKKVYYSLPHNIRRMLFSIAKPQEFKNKQAMRTIYTNNGYSYRPFDKYHCIFIHIPKTAGVSICQSLFGNLAGSHTAISKYQIVFPKEIFENYFKFTFIRNPWDRLFSAYNFLKNGGMDNRDKKWAEVKLAPYDSFDDFVKKGILQDPSILAWKHFRAQSDYLFIPYNRKLQVDFLGLFENINADFNYVSKKLGISDAKLEHKNSSNKGKNLDYKNYYTNQTRRIVSKLYRNDIEHFGYNFDNSSLKVQLEKRPMCHG